MPNAWRGCAEWLALALALSVAGSALAQDAQPAEPVEAAAPEAAPPAPDPRTVPAQSEPSDKDFKRARVLHEPSAGDIRGLYPEAARARAMGGRAAVVCEIGLLSVLENCVVTEEEPTGYGFGAATARVAQLYRVAPPTYRGEPVPHAKFRLPMRFEMELPSLEQQAADRAAEARPTPAQKAERLGPLRRADEVLWAPVGFGLAVLLGLGWALWPAPRPRRRADQLT